jgi:hypothetical protein
VKRLAALVCTALAAALIASTAAQAATTTTTVPFSTVITACNGDPIQLSGSLLFVSTTTTNSAGGFTSSTHAQPQGVSGTDLVTGTRYLGTGLTRDLLVVTAGGTITATDINRFHIQATGGAESYEVSETVHITFNANGTVTAFVDNFSPAC